MGNYMALGPDEQMLLEAIKSMLDDKAKLGLVDDKRLVDDSNTFSILHGNIEASFKLAISDSLHYDGICAAFSKVHSYKYLDDPKFTIGFDTEMKSQGIPEEDRKSAHKAYDKVLAEMKKGKDGVGAEKDSGWNPNLDEIKAVSQPEQFQTK